MAFTLYTHGQQHPPAGSYTDDDVYSFHESGVLEIRRAEESGKPTHYYAPHRWDRIEADHDHKPGATGGPYDVSKSVY